MGKRLEAVKFFYKLLNADIPHICLENPKGVVSSHIRKPDQYIHPYYFGHPDSKMTGLWLKNLPKLKPTKIVKPIWMTTKSGKRMSRTHWFNPGGKIRSETYSGIAEAMGLQWGSIGQVRGM